MKQNLSQGSVLCYTKKLKRQDTVQRAINLKGCLVESNPQKCYTAVEQGGEPDKKKKL